MSERKRKRAWLHSAEPPCSFAVITLAGLLAVGCSAAEPETSTEPTTSPTSTPSESEETSEAPSESAEASEAPAAGDADLTAPGTELAFGEKAVVTFNSGTEVKDQPVEVTVTGVTEGKIDDFTEAGLDESFTSQLDGFKTHYVAIEATKAAAATAELAFTSIEESFAAVDENDNKMQQVAVIGDFPPCDSGSFSEEIDKGATEKFCIIVVAPEGVNFGAATYDADDTPYDALDGEPVRWK